MYKKHEHGSPTWFQPIPIQYLVGTFFKNFKIFMNVHINDMVQKAQPHFLPFIFIFAGTGHPVNVAYIDYTK